MIDEQQLKNSIRHAVFFGGHGSQKAYAVSIGVHPATLSAFMTGKREAGDVLLAKLGYRRVVMFSETGAGPGSEAACG